MFFWNDIFGDMSLHQPAKNDIFRSALHENSQKQENREVTTNMSMDTPDHDASFKRRIDENGSEFFEMSPKKELPHGEFFLAPTSFYKGRDERVKTMPGKGHSGTFTIGVGASCSVIKLK